MSEEEAYAKLQELLGIAAELESSGHYTPVEVIFEIKNQFDL